MRTPKPPSLARAALAAVATAAVILASQATAAGAVGIRQGTRWSGEMAFAPATSGFTSVSGAWVQPSIAGSGSVDTWVGVTGLASTNPLSSYSLLQAGTEATTNYGGGPRYYAWVIAWDGSQSGMTILTDPVAPGDKMSVSLHRTGAAWSLSIADLTVGWSFSQSYTYPATGATADWITEAPLTWTTGTPMPLANYGTVSFSTARANGAVPVMTESVLVQNGIVLSYPVDLNPTTGTFRVHYGPCGSGKVVTGALVGITDPSAVTVEPFPGGFMTCYVPT